MSVADTSFLIRAIEFQEIDKVESQETIVITEEVKGELESKDAETIRTDRERVKNLLDKNPQLGKIEFEDLSAFEDSISSFLVRMDKENIRNEENFSELLEKYKLSQDLEKGELTCAVQCKEGDEELLIDDFIAYSELYSSLEGKVSCLCEFIIETSGKDSIQSQKIVAIMDRLFIPYEKMSLVVRTEVRRKIEDYLDSEFNELKTDI